MEDNRNGTDEGTEQCDKKPDDAISVTNPTAIPDVLSNENAVTPQQQQNNNILSIKSKKNKKKGKVDAGNNDELKSSSDASKA